MGGGPQPRRGGGVSTHRPRVIVVGGGLAGLSAAVACADRGAAVTLLERRPRLGGATWSFERRGLSFDNGQHVHLRCCEAYRSFLDRVGTADLAPFSGPLALPVLRPVGKGAPEVSWIRRDGLPAPAHLARSLLAYRHLSLPARLRLFRAALALRTARLGDPSLDRETFASFLGRHGQSAAAIARLWDLICLPTTNLRADEVSLALAAKVFKTGLLTDSDGADIAWSSVPLAELHVEPARRLLESLGATVRTKAAVSELVLGGPGGSSPPRVRGVAVEGEILEAEAVVVAVPHEAAADLLVAPAVADPTVFRRLGVSPIVNVHLVFDRTVMPYDVAAAVDSPVQFVFDRTDAAGADRAGGQQVLSISLSGADAEVGKRPAVLVDEHRRALASLFPGVARATLVDAVVTREHDATFRGVPGTRPLRAGARTGIANLALAGAWTDTGWPATMEGAVRSGNAAADVVLESVGYRGDRTHSQAEAAA